MPEIDKITLDVIENALRNAREEMDSVLFRSAMSPVIREQHDGFPMICHPDGRMVVGQFGSYINGFLANWKRGVNEGDVLIYRTAGGGWKDPFDRPGENVFKDVRNGLVSIEKAKSDYGVVLNADLSIDESATETLRSDLREKRGEFPLFLIGEVPEAIGVVATWNANGKTEAISA